MADPVITGIPRSLAPEGVEIHDRHIQWIEESKIVEILRRFMDVVTQGVLSGLTVSINAGDNTLIDILAGDGYTRGSVYAELTLGQTGVLLTDYTLNKVNLVTLVASDDDQDPEPHVDDGTVHDTKVVRQAVLNIITETAYNLLNDAQKDLRLIVARVTGQGAGIPPAPLIPTGLVNATSFDLILETTQPVNVTGTSIIQVSSNTTTGTGSLQFTAVGTLMAWKAPGDALYGIAVNVGAGGIFTLWNNGATKFIRVRVVAGSLPGLDQTDTITITNFYDQVVNRLSANDEFHRSRIGTGIVSDNNPHGSNLDDIGGDLEVVEARGSMPLLDDRLDVSLNEDGSLKPSAVNANIDHSDLKNMPDTGVTPNVAVGDHDARYGNVTYTAGPSTRDTANVIVKNDESHRDSISRLSGELSGIRRNDSSINGDALVGHNFDAFVGAGWTDAQMRSITNLFAMMFNSQDKPVVGIMYDYSVSHILVPPQVVNCKGKIRWVDIPLTLDWGSFLDFGPPLGPTIQDVKRAYYVYLSPDIAPLTSYTPKISFNVPVNGYHPVTTDWIFIGSFVTNEDGSGNIIPFVRAGNRVRLEQTLDKHRSVCIDNLSDRTQTVYLKDGYIGVIPKSAIAVKLLIKSEAYTGGGIYYYLNLTTFIGADVVTKLDYLCSNPVTAMVSNSYDTARCTLEADIPITSANGNDKTRVPGLDRTFKLFHHITHNAPVGSYARSTVWRLGWIEDLQFGVLE